MFRLVIVVIVIVLLAPIISKQLGPQGNQIVSTALEYGMRAAHQILSFAGTLIVNAFKDSAQPAANAGGWGDNPGSGNWAPGNNVGSNNGTGWGNHGNWPR